MELEVLGTRLLTPYFGSELYVVMGSVIGVFLLSLSVGYVAGGWLSARRSSVIWLGMALAAAGGWFALIPALQAPVCERLFRLVPDVRWGSLLAALALFAAPTALLGTVSPTVVRWLTRDAQRAGVSAGLVLGLSTVASFAGCIVTTFFLVVRSMRATLRTTGASLAALGLLVLLVGLWQARRRRRLFGKEPT